MWCVFASMFSPAKPSVEHALTVYFLEWTALRGADRRFDSDGKIKVAAQMKQQMSCLLQTGRRMQQMVSLCWACAQSLWLSSCLPISMQNKNICFHHLGAEEKQKCSNSRPRARLLVRSVRVISLTITFNQVHFLHSLKVLPLGKKGFFFIREEENLLVFCNVLEHRIWINEWKLTWPPPRKETTENYSKKGAWLLKVAERAFSGKAAHLEKLLHQGTQWMDAYWCQYWEECRAQPPFLITSELLNKVTTWRTNQVVANL